MAANFQTSVSRLPDYIQSCRWSHSTQNRKGNFSRLFSTFLNKVLILTARYIEDTTFQNSELQNKPSKPNDKMSCYFEDPYLRNYQCFFYPTAWNRLSIAKQIIKCAILEDTTFQNSLCKNKPSKPNDKMNIGIFIGHFLFGKWPNDLPDHPTHPLRNPRTWSSPLPNLTWRPSNQFNYLSIL